VDIRVAPSMGGVNGAYTLQDKSDYVWSAHL
jgi:hypothetical protein